MPQDTPSLSRGERRRRERLLAKAHQKMKEAAANHANDPEATNKAWRHWFNTLNQNDKSIVIRDMERIAAETEAKLKRDGASKES